jgi:hypothetical protein
MLRQENSLSRGIRNLRPGNVPNRSTALTTALTRWTGVTMTATTRKEGFFIGS